MASKLESSLQSDANRKLLDDLEGKLINLQSQLQAVREQRDKGTLSQEVQQEASSNNPASMSYINPTAAYGYPPTGRGRGGRYGGRVSGYQGRGYAGRTYMGGRGRGRANFTSKSWTNDSLVNKDENNLEKTETSALVEVEGSDYLTEASNNNIEANLQSDLA